MKSDEPRSDVPRVDHEGATVVNGGRLGVRSHDERRQVGSASTSCRRRRSWLVLALLPLTPWPAAAQLAPAVQADLYLVQTEAYVKEKDYAAAKEAMDKIVALSKQHDLALPDEFYFKHAQVLELAGAHAEAIVALTRYLELTGNTGQHYREALELLHQAMQADAAADNAAFQRARSANTVEAYGSYLRSYPEGRHVAEARRLQAAARRTQAARKDSADFLRARRVNTVEAYGAYLSSHPSGRHVAEARRLHAARADDVAFAAARRIGTAAAYEGYLDSHPAGRNTEAVRALLFFLRLEPGDKFRECEACPEMVVVPAGTYLMGSPVWEAGRDDDEGPQRRVTIGEPFAVGVYEATFAEWDACVRGGGCGRYLPDEGWGRGNRPVIYVSWEEAQAYGRWLSRETGQEYRLLSESEWEYVARAGTTTPFHTGRTISTDQANYDGNYTYGAGSEGKYREQTMPVGSFAPNAFGLYDVHGNVWEWTQDCWNESYRGAPEDGSAWERGDCGRRVIRGGGWGNSPGVLRSADRFSWGTTGTHFALGFRVARTLAP